MEKELQLYIGSRYVSDTQVSVTNRGANYSIVYHTPHLFHSLCPIPVSVDYGNSQGWAQDLPFWNHIFVGHSYDGMRSCPCVSRTR